MYSDVKSKLEALQKSNTIKALKGSLIGIEKESLRVNQDGSIAQTPHPQTLGAALTNPYITTDYSEALIELITPPLSSVKKTLSFIEGLHTFAYKRLNQEILWATSMPCVVKGESFIPVAQYGSSNMGKMKTVYREGLGHRYGKTMQIIAGVHFNYSYSKEFWDGLYQDSNSTAEYQEFINDRYFGLIRNLQRIGWIIPYLFGASPAVCKSFFGETDSHLQSFDEKTYYQPYATSLRMSDIGYQNNEENKKGFKACYDTLDEYVANLKFAIETPCPEYTKIGIKKNGEYLQLNANILQIENEYYSTVRPKQITKPNEQPIDALKNRGVQYIELRSIDINAFDPFGINGKQLHFLETLMLFCLLADSPKISECERREIDENEMLVALKGREANLQLDRLSKKVPLRVWAHELIDSMKAISDSLDTVKNTTQYSHALNELATLIDEPEKTPSARMLREMEKNKEGFHHFAKRMSYQHDRYFKQLVISKQSNKLLEDAVNTSIGRQQEIETADNLLFDDFLAHYFKLNIVEANVS